MRSLPKIYSSAGWAFLSSVTASALTFLLHIFLARSLSVSSYGSVAVVLEFLAVVIMLADMGLTVALINLYVRYTKANRDADAEFLVKAITVLKLSMAIVASGGIAIYSSQTEGLELEFWILIFAFFCAYVEVAYQNILVLLQSRELFKQLALYRVALPILRVVGIFWLLKTGHMSKTSAILLYAASSVVAFSLMFITADRTIVGLKKTFWSRNWHPEVIKDLKEFVRWTSLASVVVVFTMKMDTFLLLSLTSSTEVGLYSAAQRLAGLGTVVSSALSVVLMPRAAHINTQAELNAYVRSALMISLLFAGPVVVAGCMAEQLMELIFGANYTGSADVAALLIASFVLGVIVNPLSYVFYNQGYARYLTYLNMAQFAVGLMISSLLIPNLGALGAGISSLTTAFLGFIFIIWNFYSRLRPRFAQSNRNGSLAPGCETTT